MSWIITGTEKYETDPYRSQVSLLLHGDGVNGSTTIIDSSPSPNTVTAFGNARISTAQSKFGGASISFDGSGDYLTIPSSGGFAFGLADFTVELWLYRSGSGQQHLYDARDVGVNTNRILLYLDPSNQLTYFGDGAARITTTSVPTLNAWVHVALCRASGNSRLYLNGIQVGATFTDTINIASPTATVAIGATNSASTSLDGYIDDLRITKGVARYTSNFTPPTAPFPDI